MEALHSFGVRSQSLILWWVGHRGAMVVQLSSMLSSALEVRSWFLEHLAARLFTYQCIGDVGRASTYNIKVASHSLKIEPCTLLCAITDKRKPQ